MPSRSRRRLRVGVLFGGRSGEHEVSLASAASVIRSLDPARYEAIPIGIGKDGRWYAGNRAGMLLPEVLKRGEQVVLPATPRGAALIPATNRGTGGIRVDVVFPVLHGTFGEDGTVQGLLELADLPFVGSGVLGSAVGMDKDVQKRLFRDAGLPIADYQCLRRSELARGSAQVVRNIRKAFRLPVFVKPATLGSSVGMTKVKKWRDLLPALKLAARFGRKILVERAVDAREIEVAVLGNEKPRASIPGEIIPHREFYDYTAKYLEEGTRLDIPARLTRLQAGRFQQLAVKAFLAVEASGMSRVDFFLERGTGRMYINEINTIPGFTAISMYPKLWGASGIPYRALIDRLIRLALEEHADKHRTQYEIDLPAGAGGALKGEG